MNEVFKVRPLDENQNEFVITIGNHLATEEKFTNKEAAEERINSIDWNLVTAMIYACKEADQHEDKIKRTAKKLNKEEQV